MPKNVDIGYAKPSTPPSTLPPRLAQNSACVDLCLEHGLGIGPRRVRRNRDVVLAGRRYENLFVNQDGWLYRYKILHDGDRQILDFILPGQVFGLQACIFKTSLYSVATITDTSLFTISLDMIDRVFEGNPVLAKSLFWSAACESAILGEHLINTARRSAYERVSHLLLELFVRLRSAGLTDGMSFHMPLTQELIGDALGLTTVHVNRTLRSLREDKLVATEGKRVTLVDFEALSLIADFENRYLGETARTVRNGVPPATAGEASRRTEPAKPHSPQRRASPDPKRQSRPLVAVGRDRLGAARTPGS